MDDPAGEPAGEAGPAPPPRPRWVKVSVLAAAAVVVLLVVAALLTGGEHGPGRHLPGGDDPAPHTPPAQHSP